MNRDEVSGPHLLPLAGPPHGHQQQVQVVHGRALHHPVDPGGEVVAADHASVQRPRDPAAQDRGLGVEVQSLLLQPVNQ